LTWDNLKRKVDAGAEFLVTQLFFENDAYFRFVERCRKVGISVPVIPGIMPILSVPTNQTLHSDVRCARIPAAYSSALNRCKDNRVEVERCGVEHATEQCRDLLEQGAPGIHFYTLNRSKATWTSSEPQRIGR
jgi:methylenetetrahydrofolate reductase (NADPH)